MQPTTSQILKEAEKLSSKGFLEVFARNINIDQYRQAERWEDMYATDTRPLEV